MIRRIKLWNKWRKTVTYTAWFKFLVLIRVKTCLNFIVFCLAEGFKEGLEVTSKKASGLATAVSEAFTDALERSVVVADKEDDDEEEDEVSD